MNVWHVYPKDDLVGHDTDSLDCVCGPTPHLEQTEDGDAWIYVHHSLDGREHNEGDDSE